MLCTPAEGPVKDSMQRDYFGMHRYEWADDTSVEFHLGTGDMVRLLRKHDFTIENLIEIRAPEDAPQGRYEYMTQEWARRWPSEEIWCAKYRP